MFDEEDYENEIYNHDECMNDDIQHLLPIPEIVYNGLDYLETDLSSLNQDNCTEIHICAYNINNQLHTPFLQYFLHKPFNSTQNINEGQFIFPHFQYKNAQDLLVKSMTTIDILSSSFYKNTQFEYKGFLTIGTNVYIFYDCSHILVDTLKMTKTNDLWLVTIDEIIHYNKVCSFSIHPSIIDLFHNYTKLLYLTNSITGDTYQLPIVVYANCPIKRLDFTATFGINTTPTGIFGNYYYFTDYDTAIKTSQSQQFGLLRCILFLGNTKTVLNLVNDPIDQSHIISQKLLNDEQSTRLKLRITDYDSTWTLQYNSIYVGKVELDDGSIFQDGPLWCVKKRQYYHILTSHNIKSYPDIINDQNNAYIM